MTTRNAVLVGLALLAAALVYTLVLYPSLPPRIPIHWNLRGEVDGWGTKPWAPFFGPAVMALLLVLLFLLPWLSPRNFAVEPFRGTFNYLMVVCEALIGYMQVVMLQAALHPAAEMGRMLVAGLFLFFVVIGNVLGKVRRNFWMGVRTPWTLANDTVWAATHRLAARLMVAAGLLGAMAVWLGVPIAICFVLLIAALLVPAVYSLVLYKRLEREGQA
jgi:uncharacterized membrane protein